MGIKLEALKKFGTDFVVNTAAGTSVGLIGGHAYRYFCPSEKDIGPVGLALWSGTLLTTFTAIQGVCSAIGYGAESCLKKRKEAKAKGVIIDVGIPPKAEGKSLQHIGNGAGILINMGLSAAVATYVTKWASEPLKLSADLNSNDETTFLIAGAAVVAVLGIATKFFGVKITKPVEVSSNLGKKWEGEVRQWQATNRETKDKIANIKKFMNPDLALTEVELKLLKHLVQPTDETTGDLMFHDIPAEIRQSDQNISTHKARIHSAKENLQHEIFFNTLAKNVEARSENPKQRIAKSEMDAYKALYAEKVSQPPKKVDDTKLPPPPRETKKEAAARKKEAARLKKEAADIKKAADDAARKKADDAAIKKAADDAAIKKAADDAAIKKAAEDAAKGSGGGGSSTPPDTSSTGGDTSVVI